MNFSIKDSNGSELNIVRLSLTPGGFEIVVGDDIPQAFLEPVAAEPKPAAAVPSAAEVAPGAKSLFEEAPAAAAPAESENLFEVDADGVVWDERIHSSSKKKTGKGIWAKRKNLPEGLYESVTAQLKTGATKPTSEPVSQDRPTPNAPAASAPAAPSASAVPSAPGVPSAPAPEAPLPADNEIGDANDSNLANILAQWGS